MTDLNTTLSPALHRALELLADPPMNPDASKGYLDLLSTGGVGNVDLPKNTGAIQAVWASPLGSMFYDNAQAVLRRLVSTWLQPTEWLNIPRGGIALDVGCGPGTVTASLARAAGPDGLVWGRAAWRLGVGCERKQLSQLRLPVRHWPAALSYLLEGATHDRPECHVASRTAQSAGAAR
jgi:hypothetical protein